MLAASDRGGGEKAMLWKEDLGEGGGGIKLFWYKEVVGTKNESASVLSGVRQENAKT